MKCAMDGYPVHGVGMVMGHYLPVMVERSCQLRLSPESNPPPPHFGCHFFLADKETNWFERKHPILPGVSPSMPSVVILCLAAWLQIQLSCAIWLSISKDALLS